ncbi:hypothetical protein EHQ58_17890 [Leptospira ognonensis]|uniref:DUF2282 domain-containing protein n=1 Tax=Leptospira ognonensis TaxID=2484945 RepID=A0A4R9JWV8_9LEPT|nr:hypothetical protein [Leptospira ognonensis]TGL56490.1 hypothetical protein EHQ58_17890 [Leptospira ognonensis]
MNKLTISLILLFATIFTTSSLSAKCYGFRDAEIKVCVEGDSNADRKKAGEVCKKVNGSDCGLTTGNSGSCTGPKCYDANGNQNKNIKTNK